VHWVLTQLMAIKLNTLWLLVVAVAVGATIQLMAVAAALEVCKLPLV
jgi:hypothetical protein